jgi:general L-amino acid transport system permease protein
MAAEQGFTPIASRPPPRVQVGLLPWLQRRLFDGPLNTLLTLALVAALALVLPPLLSWGVVHAVFGADNAACRAASGSGACWGVVAEKGRLIVFGRYPYDEQWRPLLASLLLVAVLVASGVRRFWNAGLLAAWALALAGFYVLMRGGVPGLSGVETDRWGGLPLTLMLSAVSLAIAFPLAVLVALGRQSKLPAIVNTFIGAFKDTSLVTIVSLYELTGALGLALNSDVDWRPFKLEAYFFITAIYFTFCFAMSRYSLWVEKQVAVSRVR